VSVHAQEQRRLDPVVVTATKIETPQSDLGAAVTVVTEDEIRAHNYTRVEEVLRTVPGVEIQRSGSLGTVTAISIRGMGATRVQVLVDGMRVKSPTLGQADLAEFPLDAIERIEVVRGPQSTLHGSEAMAGVVNIITKKGEGPPRATLLLEGGSYDTFREQIGLSGSRDAFNYSLSASRQDSAGQLDNDDFEQTGVAARLGYVFPWKGELGLTGRYAKHEKDLPISAVNPTILDPNSQQQTETWLYNVTYTQRPLTGWELRARYGQWWNNQGFQDPPPPSVPFGGDDPTINAFANPTQQINTRRREFELVNAVQLVPWNTLTVGAEHRTERGMNRSGCSPLLGAFGISNECVNGTFTFRKEMNTVSLFAQNEIRLLDRLILSGGLRWDDSDEFRDEVTPRASAVLAIKETGTRLRAAWGKGFRTPTINDLLFPGFGRPTVKAERSESYEAGVDQTAWEGRVRFGLTAFHNEFRDRIGFVCDATGTVCGAGNQGGARTLGSEVYATVDPVDWANLWANYTFTRALRTNRVGAEGPQLTGFPQHVWNAGVHVTPVPKLALFTQAHVESSQVAFAGRKPGYHRIDAGGTWQVLGRSGILEKLELTTRVENVTDESYEETQGFGAPGLTAILGVRASFR
jgi:vitamin B12 transporter